MPRILILEDEEDMGEHLSFILKAEGYTVEWCRYGEDAVNAAKENEFDLFILDITLTPVSTPLVRYSNGIEVARVISSFSDSPYIFLTSRIDGISAMQALDQGAEDYIGKPFDISELLARIRKALRGRYKQRAESTTIGELTIDFNRKEVTKNGKVIHLSRILYEMLLYFIENKDIVVSQEDIINRVWGPNGIYENNHIAVNIKRLRSRIGTEYIKNKRGQGYVFEEPVQKKKI